MISESELMIAEWTYNHNNQNSIKTKLFHTIASL